MATTGSKVLPHASAKEEAILRASGLRKCFRMGDAVIEVLKNVDLTLRRGEFLAIEGRSGSGKSTLLHILGGLDAPDSGSVWFENQDIANFAGAAASLSRRRSADNHLLRILMTIFYWPFAAVLFIVDLVRLSRLTSAGRGDRQLSRIRNTQFGFVFQFYHLLPELSVLENTMLAPMIERSWLSFRASRRTFRDRAVTILTDLGLQHRLKHKPAQLSGGERQRVAIARALMNSPVVLFADEPTGNLDYETGQQIMAVLERLHRDKGQTIVMVTHDRTIARQADRVLILKEGRLDRPGDPPAPQAAVTTMEYQ